MVIPLLQQKFSKAISSVNCREVSRAGYFLSSFSNSPCKKVKCLKKLKYFFDKGGSGSHLTLMQSFY